MIKKNQIMITALAIMIAVAGYLNFAGTKVKDEDVMTVDSETVVDASSDAALNGTETDVTSLLDISDEDLEQASYGDIESLDSDAGQTAANYLDESMAEAVPDAMIAEQASVEAAQSSEDISGAETPGEAVFTSTAGTDALSGARLMKEQTRAKNKETYLEIINNANISETQKQEAVDGMIAITDMAEKETAAEILLEAKGFDDAVVSITDGMADVVVNAAELSEAQRAQIEDIVTRKTGISAESVVINTVAAD